MMDERGKRIQESLDEAETTKKKAIASRKEYDELVTDARRKSADIVLEALQGCRGRARSHHRGSAQGGRGHHRQGPCQCRGRAQRHLRSCAASIADLSVSVASKIVGETLDQDGEQRRLIERYVKEAGSLNA